MSQTALARAIGAVWWPLFPLFCLVVPWSARERLLIGGGAGRAFEPFETITLQPGLSWITGIIYVLAWAWLLAVCVRALASLHRVVPGIRTFVAALGPDILKTALLLAAVAADQLPSTVWRLILGIPR